MSGIIAVGCGEILEMGSVYTLLAVPFATPPNIEMWPLGQIYHSMRVYKSRLKEFGENVLQGQARNLRRIKKGAR